MHFIMLVYGYLLFIHIFYFFYLLKVNTTKNIVSKESKPAVGPE